jgi:intracellular multiplication protein IcmW
MTKLDLQAAHEYWKNYHDPMIYRVIAFMETVEDWTYDNNAELEQVINQLGDGFGQLSKFELSKEAQFVNMCAHLKTSRILYLLQTIDTIDPGSASRVLMYAEENNTDEQAITRLFLHRNIVFERLRLLARIFSSQRFDFILKALEHEYG